MAGGHFPGETEDVLKTRYSSATQKLSDQKATSVIELLTINCDLTAFTHIAKKIPMDSTLIPGTALRESQTGSYVYCAADFLVEKHVLRKDLDRVVCSNPKLPEPVRAMVGR